MTTKPDEAIFVSVKDAAAKMGVTTFRLYQLAAGGEFPAVKRGRRVLIPARAFENYVENLNRQALENLNRQALENLTPGSRKSDARPSKT